MPFGVTIVCVRATSLWTVTLMSNQPRLMYPFFARGRPLRSPEENPSIDKRLEQCDGADDQYAADIVRAVRPLASEQASRGGVDPLRKMVQGQRRLRIDEALDRSQDGTVLPVEEIGHVARFRENCAVAGENCGFPGCNAHSRWKLC
ncbi:hypothetical protein VQ042_24585 [Aurantimonas sp. A2-1-M11]|uniref:hypothetical protein n=1 Tax=Aurantimonas sp. A2-1-M11 TaxID=3113712 RepID=UPI002F955DC8